MFQWLWLIVVLPLAGFLTLALFGGRLGRTGSSIVGVGSIGLAALITLGVGAQFLSAPPDGHVFVQTLWSWISVGNLNLSIALRLDSLSLVMIFVVTFVGFWIHLYSTEYMADDEAFSRFFAYMNLFVASMLMLVLADSLVFLYLGWEGVGLCSYLLIGFWHKDPANGSAARKAFLVTRIGDAAMAVGLFLIFQELGTLHIQDSMARAQEAWPVGSGIATAAALLLFVGAMGKSAQLPLQIWLPDAMAGPTPVSALIHAATMVTAGVYLLARTNALFLLSPVAMGVVGAVGAATLFLAACSALVQTDIKRVLAYSTISQLGYMFVALGVGAWSAAMFHFMTHAFFKALLFLGSGAVILAAHHEQNMFKMGGLRKELPGTFWTFLIGSAALAALPLVTAGFYSKDLILWRAWNAGPGGRVLYLVGIAAALLTSIYTFRMVFLTFFGEMKTHVHHRPGPKILIPLSVLAFFSIMAGFIELPHTMGNFTWFSDVMHYTLPHGEEGHGSAAAELTLQIVAAIVAFAGLFIAWLFYIKRPELAKRAAASPAGSALGRFWLSGWGFDALYDRLFVRPFYWLARINRADVVDSIYTFAAWTARVMNSAAVRTQTGRIRWYATGIAAGAILILAFVVFS